LEREQLGILQKTYGSNLVKVYVSEANYSLKEKVLPLFSEPITKLKHWPKKFPETHQNKSQQKAMRRSAQPSQYFFFLSTTFLIKENIHNPDTRQYK
jgi:glucosamine 6-phosphate synthetase-like amidotransferase/phosphosugar isomerase protein